MLVDLPECEIPFGQVTEKGRLYWVHGYDFEIDAHENIKYIYDSVRKYCEINECAFSYELTENPIHDLSVLFDIAADAVTDGNEIVLDYDPHSNKIVLKEYAMCDFDYRTLFFLPVSFVERLPEELRPLLKELVSIIVFNADLQTPHEHMDMSFALGDWDCGERLKEMREEDSEFYEEYIKIVESYDKGEIHDLITDCCRYHSEKGKLLERLDQEIKSYKDSSIGRLLSAFREAVILSDEDRISNYTESPYHCYLEDYDNHEEGILDNSRLYAVVYDLMDPVVEQAMDCINGDGGSIDLLPLYDCRILTPEMTNKHKASDFPKRWCKMFETLLGAIIDLQNERTNGEPEGKVCA